MKKINDEFMELLVQEKVLTEEDKTNLLKKFNRSAADILHYLIEGGAASRDLMAKLWGDSINKAYVDLGRTMINYELFTMLPSDIAKKYRVVPLYKFGDTVTI
ncbi:MAG: hypothetical protein LRY51_14790, partial [Geovibrio sp.]|nr:hypothetical protein [Geovibrio sp.]